MSYPSIKDNNFYDKINKLYKKHQIPKKKLSVKEYCKPKEFKLQEPQQFLSEYINPKTPYKSILIYHRIGAGKTCSAIQIAEKWKDKRKILFVLPASLKGNFMSELRSRCGGYLTKAEQKQLITLKTSDEEYIKIMKESVRRIEKYYTIYSYNKFIELIKEGKLNLKNTILFIDEIQNMVSETGTYYRQLYNLLYDNSNDVRIVLLSATPMFDKPSEIALTINLLKPEKLMPVGREFDKMFIKEKKNKNETLYSVQNMDIFKKMLKGYISFYDGAPSYTFPEMTIKYIECEMNDFQYNIYKKLMQNENVDFNYVPTKETVLNAIDLPNNFYIGTRFVSNIVFPNQQINERGYDSLTETKILNHLDKYSCKFSKIINSIKKTKGKIFIYSGFKEYAGLKTLCKILDTFGYKNFVKHGVGPKRYAVWSGDETIQTKDDIRDTYNKIDNLYGSHLKIILGSPSIKEGVTLKAVRGVHVLEPYWNKSRLEQVIGRASRFCSHINLPEEERNVKVYVYIATHPNEKITIDQYIKKLSETKNKIIKQFELAIKEAAVDCKLNYYANTDKTNKLKCM